MLALKNKASPLVNRQVIMKKKGKLISKTKELKQAQELSYAKLRTKVILAKNHKILT